MRTVERIMSDIENAKVAYDAIVIGLKKELESAKEAEEAAKNEPWVPKRGEFYWCVTASGTPYYVQNMGENADKLIIARHNCFRTRKEAEADEENRTVTCLLRDAATKAGRKNGEFISGVSNYIIVLNHNKKGISIVNMTFIQSYGDICFPSNKPLCVAISEIGEDRIKKALFGVTE